MSYLKYLGRCCLLALITVAWGTTASAQLRWHPRRMQPPLRNASIAEACPRHYVSNEPSLPACPTGNGIFLLPAHYPPRMIFVGYEADASHLAFLQALIETNQQRKQPLQIVILLPRLQVEQAYHDLRPFMKGPDAQHITFFATPSDETLWTQDYMEVGISVQDGEAKIIDLPYNDREGESIPASLALSCHLDLIEQADYESQRETPGSGDYGGNIEALPGNVVLVGNNMTYATRQRLREALPGMVMLDINVDWLLTGHVDEIFTVLPNMATHATCPFAMAYASPELALHVVQQHGFQPPPNNLLSPASLTSDTGQNLLEPEFFTRCLTAYTHFQPLSPRCRRFINANRTYAKRIEHARQRINAVLLQRNACPRLNWIALPQLFTPSSSMLESDVRWGSQDDFAEAVNPNVVNVIALGREVIIPQQPYAPFAREVEQRLRPLALSLIRVDSSYSHALNGGLHCNSKVVRMCRSNRLPAGLQ
jgi:hypothetical protein